MVPLSTLLVLLCVSAVKTSPGAQPAALPRRWRWPESFDPALEPVPSRGRYIASRPTFGFFDNDFGTRQRPPSFFSTTLPPPPVQTTSTPSTTSSTANTNTLAENESASNSTGSTTQGTSLLKDAGKPGNPYALLNVMFPPANSLRTPEEEAQSQASLKGKDLGGLHPEEVYYAEDDLFVLKGYNLPTSYSPVRVHPADVIDDSNSAKPRPPVRPEPGTAFFHFPDYIKRQFPYLPFPDPRDDPRVQQMALFGGPNDPPPFNWTEDGRPFPFIPPPPPHWDSTKNLDLNPQLRPPIPDQPPPPPPLEVSGPAELNSPPSNDTNVPGPGADDAEVDFMPLYPERPLDYYYPGNPATEVPPGPAGPGVYVPPPQDFFATFNRPPIPLRQQQSHLGRPQALQAIQALPGNTFTPSSTARTVQPGHSLHSDIAVNFQNPLPEENPDAEYLPIDTPTTTTIAPPISWYNVNININGHAAPHQYPGLSIYLPPYVRYNFEATTPRTTVYHPQENKGASVRVYQQGLGVDYAYRISA